MRNKSLGKNAVYNIIYKILNVFFPIISIAYVSRVLLSDGVGRISVIQNNVSYFLILATLGIPVYGVREIAKCRENEGDKNKLFSELFTINIIFTVATYILFNIIVFSNLYFRSEIVLYEIFGLTLLLNIFNVDWLYQGMEEYGYIATRSMIVKIASIIALVSFVKSKDDIYLYAVIQVIAVSSNYILNVLKSRSYVRYSLKNVEIKRHFRPLVYLTLCSVSTELYAKMDITMLDVMKSSNEVGYYSNSQKIISLLINTLVAITAVFMPRLSFLFEKDKAEFIRLLKSGVELMAFISVPACVGVMIVAEPLVLSFLGEDFLYAVTTVSILSLMIPLKCIGDLICYQVMMCASQEVFLMKSYFITMVVNAINNFLLIPRFGAEGASVASVISEILAFGFVLFYSRRYFNLEGIRKIILKTELCTAVMACSILPIKYFQCSCFIKLALEGFLGVLVYIVACVLFKHEVLVKYAKLLKNKLKR